MNAVEDLNLRRYGGDMGFPLREGWSKLRPAVARILPEGGVVHQCG
jgi:hypothetical protein